MDHPPVDQREPHEDREIAEPVGKPDEARRRSRCPRRTGSAAAQGTVAASIPQIPMLMGAGARVDGSRTNTLPTAARITVPMKRCGLAERGSYLAAPER